MTNAVWDRPTRSFPRALGSRRASAVAPAPVPSHRKSRLCPPWAIIHSRPGRPLALSAAPPRVSASTERRADPVAPSFPAQQLHPRGQGARLQVRRRPPRHGAVRARPDPPPTFASSQTPNPYRGARNQISNLSPPFPPIGPDASLTTPHPLMRDARQPHQARRRLPPRGHHHRLRAPPRGTRGGWPRDCGGCRHLLLHHPRRPRCRLRAAARGGRRRGRGVNVSLPLRRRACRIVERV